MIKKTVGTMTKKKTMKSIISSFTSEVEELRNELFTKKTKARAKIGELVKKTNVLEEEIVAINEESDLATNFINNFRDMVKAK